MLDKYLSVGTIVKLSKNTKRVMIVGYFPKSMSSGNMYDYFGVLFPYGYQNNEEFVLFNHEQVLEICYCKTNTDVEYIELNDFLKKNK
jgi:hypothetical protein